MIIIQWVNTLTYKWLCIDLCIQISAALIFIWTKCQSWHIYYINFHVLLGKVSVSIIYLSIHWQKTSLIFIKAEGTYVNQIWTGVVCWVPQDLWTPARLVLAAEWKEKQQFHYVYSFFSSSHLGFYPLRILYFTSAGNTHIFIVVTVVDAPPQTTALAELHFTSSAVHIIQHDEPSALSKLRAAGHRHSHPASQLTTHDICIHHVPIVITHGAPRAVVLHLHSALTPAPPIHQLYFREMSRKYLSGFLSQRRHFENMCFWYEEKRLARL